MGFDVCTLEACPRSGRKKGTPNKRPATGIAGIRSKKLPLQLWADILDGKRMRLPGTNTWHIPTWEDMKWAAKEAAPYMHAKKAQRVEHGGNDGRPVKVEIVQFGKEQVAATAS